MYESNLQIMPAPVRAGQPETLTISVRDRGQVVSTLAPAHEKEMHTFIVSKDLAEFAHVHPSREGDALVLPHTFHAAGEYTVILDYQQPGRGQVVDRHPVTVEGAPRNAVPLAESPAVQCADGVQLALHRDAVIHAGEAAMLHFDTDVATGIPVDDLEPYLGAMAHLAVLSADGRDFVHVHPQDSAPGASRVSAHAVFPRAGLYKMWVQMQRHGQVVTAAFVVPVQAARAEGSQASMPEHGRHH